MYLATPTLGQPQKPVEIVIGPASMVWKLPRLACTTGQLAKVSAIMGQPVTRDQVRAAVLKAGVQAQDLATDGWVKLHKQTLPADIEKLFAASFGVASTARPVAGGSTMHRIVAARFAGAIRKLGDDDVHVSCWGWPWGGIPKDEPETYFANNVPRRHGIALGKHFWIGVRDGDAVSPGAAMLGTALNLFYYRLKFSASTPRTIRSSCYLRFALLAAGQAVPEWIESKCGP